MDRVQTEERAFYQNLKNELLTHQNNLETRLVTTTDPVLRTDICLLQRKIAFVLVGVDEILNYTLH